MLMFTHCYVNIMSIMLNITFVVIEKQYSRARLLSRVGLRTSEKTSDFGLGTQKRMIKDYALYEFTDDIAKTIALDKDFLITIDGDTGTGKSTMALKIAKSVQPDYDMNTQMVFSAEEFLTAINSLPRGSVIVADEAVTMLFSRDFMTNSNKDIVKKLNLVRYKNYIILFLIPNFWDLEKGARERMKVWIHIKKRGLGIMMHKTGNPAERDKWMEKEKKKEFFGWDSGRENLERVSGCFGTIQCGDMTLPEKEEYEKLKEERRLLRESPTLDKPNDYSFRLWKMYVLNLLLEFTYKRHYVTNEEFSKIMGRKQQISLDNFGDILTADQKRWLQEQKEKKLPVLHSD